MLIDASHKNWIIGCSVVTIVGVATYIPYHLLSLNGPRGGSWPGLIYGFVAFGLMVFCLLLSARKKIPTWRIGRAETWLRGHIWLGLLSVPFVFFHSGFRFGGTLTTMLMALTVVIILSGIFGVVLQQHLPRVMTTQVPMETVYEEIPHVLDQLRLEAGALVWSACGGLDRARSPIQAVVKSIKEVLDQKRKAEASQGGGEGRPEVLRDFFELTGIRSLTLEEVRDAIDELVKSKSAGSSQVEPESVSVLQGFFQQEFLPFLADRPSNASRLATRARSDSAFRQLRTVLPPTLHEVVSDLEAISEERRQLAQQARLHLWLHGWLFVHVPLSMALLVLLVAHAVMTLRY
jgi:hypothetical protein